MSVFSRLWRGLSAAAIAGALAFASSVAIEAQDPMVTNGYVACGGRGEPACGFLSEFFMSNGSVCDRGLKDDNGVCVNDKRRQGVGQAFAQSWAGRALRSQRRDLNWRTSFGRVALLEPHNAFNNEADSYAFTNQKYSLTELLDAGIRAFEWDVHYNDDTQSITGAVPELCHGTADHVGCVYADRDFFNAAKELRDWMLEPGHDNEVVFIDFEYRVDNPLGHILMHKAIEAYLDLPGIGVLTKAELDAHMATTTGEFTRRTASDGQVHTTKREWPSQEWLVSTNNRIIFQGPAYADNEYYVVTDTDAWIATGAIYEPLGLAGNQTIVQNWTNTGQLYPTCAHEEKVDRERDVTDGSGNTVKEKYTDFYTKYLRPQSGAIHRVYSSDHLVDGTGFITPQQVKELTDCNIDRIAFDGFLTNEDRLAAAVWSWDVDEPAVDAAGMVARMSRETGRWAAVSPQASRPFVCRKETRVNVGLWIKNLPAVSFRVTESADQFGGGHAACAALGADWTFAPPLNGHENLDAKAAIAGADDPYINFRATGNDRWRIWERPSVDEIVVNPQPADAGNPVYFGLSTTGFDSPVVTWTFEPGVTEQGDTSASHAFSNAGDYDVTATVTDATFGATASITQRITVRDLNPLGPRIVIEAPPSVLEGTTLVIPFSHKASWDLLTDRVSCGEGADNLGIRFGTTVAERRNGELTCRFHPTSDRIARVTVAAREAVGLTIVEHSVSVAVVNQKPVLTAPEKMSVAWNDTTDLLLQVADYAGDKITVTVDWGWFGAPETITGLDPGPIAIRRHFTFPTMARLAKPVIVKVYDEDPEPTTATVMIDVVGPAPTGTMEGPTRVTIGSRANFYVTATDPDGGEPTLTDATCGDAGRRVGWAALGQKADGWEFSIRCEFTATAASNHITVTVQDDEMRTTRFDRTVMVGEPPFISIEGPTTVAEGTAATFIVRGGVTDGDNVGLDSVSCGSGTLVNTGPDTTPDANLSVAFKCRFGGGPATTDIVATVRDTDGTSVITSPITIANAAPTVTVFSVPALVAQSESATVTGQTSDPGGDAVSVHIEWGDGSTSTAASVDNSFSQTHTWAASGSYVVTVIPTDDEGAAGDARTATVVVRDTAKPVLALPVLEPIEASGPLTPVTFTATATDNVDPSVTVSCAPTSGDGFRPGTSPVQCSATDAAGNTATGSFDVVVRDTTAPAITVPPALTVPAAGTSAVVTFSVSASDKVDGDGLLVSCSPASGATFPPGTTKVMCSATDRQNNGANAGFDVTVVDKTAPTLSVSSNLVAEATGPDGAPVAFAALATDAIDPHPVVGCATTGGALPDGQLITIGVTSGAVFPLGLTPVTCSATDASGNSSTAGFTVTVRDTTAPTLTLPANITVAATGLSGAPVTFDVSAVDRVDGPIAAVCSPASGTAFPAGVTATVRCTAADRAANQASGTFTVTVRDAATPGEMRGDGFVRDGDTKYDFQFRVRERASGANNGSFALRVSSPNSGRGRNRVPGRDDRFVARNVANAFFSDDPTMRPGRPRRPQVDTVNLVGVGDWNGRSGYRYEVFAQDAGEPGRHRESVRIRILDPSGQVVAVVEGDLDGGNVQSVRIHR